MKAKILISTFF